MLDKKKRDEVMGRIQAMLAIAADPRANPHEAAQAAAMAEKTMRKYQIEEAAVISASLKAGEDLDTSEHYAFSYDKATNGTKRIPAWADLMAVQVAKFMNCGVRKGKNVDGDMIIRFYGYKQDVTVAGWMFDYFVGITKAMTKEYARSTKSSGAQISNYRRGFGSGIWNSLKEALDKKEAEEREEASKNVNSRELMIVKEEAISNKFGAFTYLKKDLPVPKGDDAKNTSAFIHGHKDGKKVDINVRGVGTNATTLKIGN